MLRGLRCVSSGYGTTQHHTQTAVGGVGSHGPFTVHSSSPVAGTMAGIDPQKHSGHNVCGHEPNGSDVTGKDDCD